MNDYERKLYLKYVNIENMTQLLCHGYANNGKVEIFHALGPRHLRHDKVALLNIYNGLYSIFHPYRGMDN